MNDGSVCSDDEYQLLKKRFDSIFNLSGHNSRVSRYYIALVSFTNLLFTCQKVIYLPGDNDIGGEGSDRVTEEKIQRFNKNFPSSVENNVGNLQFITVSNH